MKLKKNKEIFIWGTGQNAKKINITYDRELKKENIIGYIDNDIKKQGTLFLGKPVYAPDILNEHKDAYIFISIMNKNEIRKQVSTEYPLHKDKILNANYFEKIQLITRYEKSSDPEIKEIISYLTNHQLDVFNYSYVENYKEDDIFIGKEHGLYYTLHKGSKLFFSKDYDTEEKAKHYYHSLLIEQDEKSPHRYLTETFDVPDSAVVIDLGAAEGIFSLDVIDRAEKIYMFEPDENWIEALRYTFEPYRDKIVIINQCISNYTDEKTTSLDLCIKENEVNFIKIDIEGEEYYALRGAENLLKRSENIRCVVCTYHQEFAYEAIKNILDETGFTVTHSNGYMWYPEHFNIMRPPVLRRGLIYGEKICFDNK